MNHGSLLFAERWHREGRGLTAEVEGLTAGMVERAIGALPPEWAPYVLLVVTSRKEGKHYDVVQVADAAQLDDRRADGDWYYFLWSPVLTPELSEPLVFRCVDSRALSLSGLVNMQYRHLLKGREYPTRVGCVDVVRSDEGEQVRHDEYENIYRSLLRSLLRSLRKARG